MQAVFARHPNGSSPLSPGEVLLLACCQVLASAACQDGCIVLGGILQFICLTDRTHRERGAAATAAAASASAEMAVKRQDGCIVLGGILQLVRLRCRQTGTPTAAAAAAT